MNINRCYITQLKKWLHCFKYENVFSDRNFFTAVVIETRESLKYISGYLETLKVLEVTGLNIEFAFFALNKPCSQNWLAIKLPCLYNAVIISLTIKDKNTCH